MPAPKKKTYSKKNKKITLAEFRAWLEGVEELQPKDWVPDATQWKLIRNKVNCIVEPEPQVIETSTPGSALPTAPEPLRAANPLPPELAQKVAARNRVPVPQPVEQPAAGWGAIGKGGPPIEAGPAGPSALDEVLTAPQPATPAAAGGGLPAGQPMQTAKGVVPGTKTPDIDTSNGEFASPFS